MQRRIFSASCLLALLLAASTDCATATATTSIAPARPLPSRAALQLYPSELPGTWRVWHLNRAAVLTTLAVSTAACLLCWALGAALAGRRTKVLLRLRLPVALDVLVGLHVARHLYVRAVLVGRPRAPRTWWQRLAQRF
mmetsp:Transcript_1336/g.3141  ORF Transcript_1336/g.3141 Transcript_1336/m.3141 type:complete len:139 (-) Transcript_1336:409-825(-)|eukprot:jgi/Tetstr1/431395/TSEL_021085.t1